MGGRAESGGGREYSLHVRGHEVALRADGEKHGIVAIRAGADSVNLVREPYFALNVYRFMCAGKLMAYARTEPFDVERSASGLTLCWRPTRAHPGTLRAEYAVKEPAIVDLTLQAEVSVATPGYEVYISSYFDYSLEPYAIVSEWPGARNRDRLKLLKLEDAPFIHGHYLVFPRDSRAASLRFDGRWIDPANGRPMAYWATGPFYARPIVIMARGDLFVAQMADPGACLAVAATYASPDPSDDIQRHNATYLSFFGDDAEPGEVRTARVRQVVGEGPITLEKVLELYDVFRSDLLSWPVE